MFKVKQGEMFLDFLKVKHSKNSQVSVFIEPHVIQELQGVS